MRRRRGFHFRGTHPLAGHLEGVVAAALDVPEAVVVDARPVTVHPDIREAAPVGRQVLLRIAPEPPRHAGPRLANDEFAEGTAQRAAPPRVRDVGGDPGHGAGERGRLERRPRRAAEDTAGALGAARVIDEGDAFLTRDAEVPPPRLGIPGLAGRAEDEQRRAIVVAHWGFSGAHQAADRGRGNAEVRHTMSLHDRPHSTRVWKVGRAVIEQDRGAIDEPAGDQPRTHHPADIGEPPQEIAGLEVEDVGEILGGLHREPAVHVHRALRPSCRARGVDEHVRIFWRRVGD